MQFVQIISIKNKQDFIFAFYNAFCQYVIIVVNKC